jgi:signal transduction histidine kinase
MTRFLDFFLPKQIVSTDDDSDTLLRARVIVIFWIFGIIVSSFIWLTCPSGHLLYYISLSLVVAVCVISLICFKFSFLSLEKLGITSTLTHVSCLILFIYSEGVVFSATTNWASTAVLLAVCFVNLRFGFFILAIMIGVMTHSHFYFRHKGLTLPPSWSYDKWADNLLLDQVFSLIALYIVIIFLIYSNRKMLHRLLGAREVVYQSSRLTEMGKVAASIAHEVNNPLSVIIGNSNLIQNELTEEKIDLATISKFNTRINRSCNKAFNIVRNIMNLARDVSSEKTTSFQLSKLMLDIQEVAAAQIMKKKIKFELKTAGDDIVLRGKYTQLYQALVNLLNNAIDAVIDVKQPSIIIEICRSNSSLDIMIIDNGPGISPELEKRVLEPLFTTKNVGKGTGLGLSIVNNMLEQHDGKLIIDRRFKDSRMTVRLPLSMLVE